MVFTAGSRLGAYEVRCLLGTGGMGEVYEARDPRLDRFVALKVLKSEVASDPDRLNRFEREARAVAALNHPNIVTLHGIEETDGTRFLVMERIQGRPLSELIEPGGLPLKQILDWAIPIADALAAAHAHGVVHRDLKPGNVMVSEEGRPKILDFGLARISAPPSSSVHTGSVTEMLTAEGNVFGTVPYMAPEQLRGERADAPTDLFAFGVMLYEMAAGRRPFAGATQAEVAASILKEDPPPLEGIRTDLPAAFIKIVRHCLEKDPRQRIQSAADLRHELSDLAEELRTHPAALAPVVLPPARPAAKKHWVRLALVASIPLVTVALLLILHPFSPKPAGAMLIQSLAVLPLKNYSGDASQDFFADGMTDALIADLAQIRALKVISRTSAMLYKDTKKPITEIAKELGVEGIVEGSVVRSGSRVRVTAQLIDARQDRHLWASNYEREMIDVLALQGEVAGAIASEIRVQVTPEESVRLKTARPVDAEVYDTTLRGKATLEYATREEQARQAIDLFQKAVDRDPTYAPAFAGFGEALWFLAGVGGEFVAPAEVRDKAIEAADRALKLDPNLADANKARAVIAIDGEWDLEKAQRYFERALELRPGYAAAHNLYGQMLLSPLSRFDESRRHLDRARELDPLSPWNDINLVAWWLYQGKIEKALAEGERGIQRNPTVWILPWQMGFARLLLGQPNQAVPEFEAALKLLHSDRPADALAPLGLAYGLAERRTSALKILAEMEIASQKRYISPFDFAVVYSGLGRMDEAFRLLDRALEQRTPWLFACTPNDPLSVALRRDPRWKHFVDRLRKAVRLPPGTPNPYS